MSIKSPRNSLSLLMETNSKHLNSHQEVLVPSWYRQEPGDQRLGGVPWFAWTCPCVPHLMSHSWQEARALEISAYS